MEGRKWSRQGASRRPYESNAIAQYDSLSCQTEVQRQYLVGIVSYVPEKPQVKPTDVANEWRLPRVSVGIYGGLQPTNVPGFVLVININEGNVFASGFLEYIDSGVAAMITASDRNTLGLQEHESLAYAFNTNPAALDA